MEEYEKTLQEPKEEISIETFQDPIEPTPWLSKRTLIVPKNNPEIQTKLPKKLSLAKPKKTKRPAGKRPGFLKTAPIVIEDEDEELGEFVDQLMNKRQKTSPFNLTKLKSCNPFYANFK